MAAQRIVPSLVMAIGSIIAVQDAAFAQEHRGTMEQRMACTPDVFRLCGAQIPDADRILGCLRQNTALLSEPCRAVFHPDAGAPQHAAAPHRRAAQPSANAVPPTPDDEQ